MIWSEVPIARARCFSDEPKSLQGDERDAFG